MTFAFCSSSLALNHSTSLSPPGPVGSSAVGLAAVTKPSVETLMSTITLPVIALPSMSDRCARRQTAAVTESHRAERVNQGRGRRRVRAGSTAG